MAQADLDKVPSIMQVGEYQACIFHLLALSTCKRCDQVGHRPSDPKCPVKAIDLMMDMVETFHGGKCQLSNLHTCPEGCVTEDKGTSFPSSEYHYQFKKLKHHDKGAEAYEMLMQEDIFKAMKLAKDAVPDDEVLESWQLQQEMIDSCRWKYQACSHTREKLMASKLILAEATGDKFWSSGLNVAQTKECLTEYWPGQNVMGMIFVAE